MDSNEMQACEVIAALRKYVVEIDYLLSALGDRKTLTREAIETIRARLTSLKASIKAAAKRGTVCDGGTPPNEYEILYFKPAVSNASANFTVPVNSHPINSDWFSCLYSVRIDISHLLGQLERQYSKF